MKKSCMILILILILSGCSNQYKNWENIEISDVGMFKIPPNMLCIEMDGIIYLTENNNEVFDKSKSIMIGVLYDKNSPPEMISGVLGKELTYEKLLFSETFSNSAIVGKKEYLIDGVKCEKIFLDLYSSKKNLYFLMINNTIDYSIVNKIAKSFVADTK